MREGPSGKRFDDQWREIPDDTPVSVSVNLRPKSMEQMVALYVQQAMALQSKMSGEESALEAEDIEVDDEGDSEVLTPYELHALAADAERDARRRAWLTQQIKGGRMGASVNKGDRDGRTKVDEGVGGVGQAGSSGKADGKSESGAVAGNSEEAGRVTASGGVAAGAGK